MTELEILSALDDAVSDPRVARHIANALPALDLRLRLDPDAPMSWEPIPLPIYSSGALPPEIRSSWIFILRKGTTTGAERHPNSHQRMMSYRGGGDFPIQRDGQWESRRLTSDRTRDLSERWVSIAPYTWHQGIVDTDANWVVVSFHTAPAEELIEERPGEDGTVDARLYLTPEARR